MNRDEAELDLSAGSDQVASPEHLEPQLLALSQPDTQAFVGALLNPQPVNDRLRETVRRYREIMAI